MFQVRQHSALNGFRYTALSTDDQPIAELEWPNFAQAKNARLRVHDAESAQGDVRIRLTAGRLASEDFRIGFEYLNTARRNDVRFTLHQGGAALGLAEVLFPPQRLKRARVEILKPLNATLVRHSSLGRLHYCWERDGRTLGTIDERKWLSLKRELTVNLPSTLSLPVQLFMTFLVINDAFR
jgi:hypothetical protein